MREPDRPGTGDPGPGAPWRRHLHLLAAVLAVVIALAGLTVFLTSRQTELAEGTAVPPASPSATAPSTATPVTGAIAYPPGSLPALLGLAPDWLDDEDQALPVQAAYADIAGWLHAAGLDPASADAADLRGALDPLGLPEVLASRGLDTEWRRVYGFDLRDIDQVLAVGQAPNLVLIMPGRYDADALYATWVASGYQAVEVEGTTVWSLSPGERIDLTAPASRPALGLMNTVVLLDDGTLIATSRQSRMAETLRVVHGDDDALIDRSELRDAVLSSHITGSPSVVIASGRLLQRPAMVPAAGTAVPVVAGLPEVDLVVLALVARGPDAAPSVVMTMIYDEPPDDVAAIPATLERRVADDAGWSGWFRLVGTTVVGEGSMIEVRFEPLAALDSGLTSIGQRDLQPFTWIAGD